MTLSTNISCQCPQYYTMENKISATMDAWERVAMVDYEELASKTPLTSFIVKLAKKGTVKVLDVGCGTGMFWKVLSNKMKLEQLEPECFSNITVSLVDISDYCLDTAAQTISGLGITVKEKLQTSLENVHLSLSADQSFDIVWSLHLLSNVEPKKIHAFFESVPKLLNANGAYWNLQLTRGSFYHEADVFHSRLRGHAQPRFLTAEKVQDLATSAMKDISVQELEYYHCVKKSDTDTLDKTSTYTSSFLTMNLESRKPLLSLESISLTVAGTSFHSDHWCSPP